MTTSVSYDMCMEHVCDVCVGHDRNESVHDIIVLYA